MPRLLPRQSFPNIAFPLAAGGRWSLAERSPRSFVMLVFFRHAHCSFCRRQLSDIDNHFQNLIELGVDPIAVSSDSEKRTQTMIEEIQLENLAIGYDLPLDTAASLGLYISSQSKETEPKNFSEPGLFLIDRNHSLFMTATQNMAFGRPTMCEVLEAITVCVEKNVSARGQVDPTTLGKVAEK